MLRLIATLKTEAILAQELVVDCLITMLQNVVWNPRKITASATNFA
jgi:hypothetical protein